MKLTWYGHAAMGLQVGQYKLWLTCSPAIDGDGTPENV
jgi:hypothetical protein